MYKNKYQKRTYQNIFNTQPKPVRKVYIKGSSPTPLNLSYDQLSKIPRQNLLKYIQQQSMVDNSRCIEYDPLLLLKQQKLVKQLINQNQQETQSIDMQQIKRISKKSIQSYYKHYKKLKRIKQQNILMGTKSSPYTALLQSSNKLHMLPKCIGLIRNQGGESQLKINDYKIGDQYASILSQGLASMNTTLTQINLSNNRITDKGATQLMHKIRGKVKSIDFSNNFIINFDSGFILRLQNKECTIQNLNFQNNRLSKFTITQLLCSLQRNKSVKILNLSQNLMKDEHAQQIANLIIKHQVLQQLYLRWNKLGVIMCKYLFQALAKNQNIVVIDLSFNLLGGNGVSSICQFLNKNKTVLHMDLSQNNFQLQQCDQIALALKSNKTIYGFHFGGNYGYIDSKGFLIIQGEGRQAKSIYKQTVDFKIKSVNIRKFSKRSIFDSQTVKDICWICQGWVQKQFQISQDQTAWVHLSHQGFTGRYLNTNQGKSTYQTMIPPGILKYLYSNKQIAFHDPNENIRRVQTGNSWRKFYYFKDSKLLQVKFQNQMKILSKPIIDRTYSPIITVLPRFPQNKPLFQIQPIPKWRYQISVWFKQWKGTDSTFNAKCFQRDWNHSKIPKIIKNQQDQQKVKQLLLKNYVAIRSIYKYYSATSPVGDTWAITSNTFTEFCNYFKIVDVRLPLKILDLVFITTNSATAPEWRGNSRNPQRGLIRYQFLQCLIRLSDQKYIKNNISDSFYSSISNLFNQSLNLFMNQFSYDKWRSQKYFCQQCDLLIKKYRPILESVFKKFSKLKVKPGQKPFMSVEQFKQICIKIDLASGKYQKTQKDASICYNLAMMIQIDQLQSDRIFKMQFIQFVEGLAKMCDLACPPKINTGQMQLTKNDRMLLSIGQKFQWGIYQLLKNFCSQQILTAFKEQFKISMFPLVHK